MKIKVLIGVILFICVSYMAGFFIATIRANKKVERLELLLKTSSC